jgi:hypothetical protein
MKQVKGDAALKTFIKGLKPKSVVLFVIDSQKYHDIHPKLLKAVLSSNGTAGIYITVNKPYAALQDYLKDNKIDTSNMFFIDAITKTVGDDIKMTDDCLYIPSPNRLTDMAMALTQALDIMENKERKFIFLDSLSTMLIYNPVDVVAKFVHFVISKLRLFSLVGIIISIEKQIDERMVNILVEMCDETVELK